MSRPNIVKKTRKSVWKLSLTATFLPNFQVTVSFSLELYCYRNIVPKCCPRAKSLSLHEPKVALVWVDAFEDGCRAEKEIHVDANIRNQGYLPVTDLHLLCCCVKNLRKVKSLVAPREKDTRPFKGIETVPKFFCAFVNEELIWNSIDSRQIHKGTESHQLIF